MWSLPSKRAGATVFQIIFQCLNDQLSTTTGHHSQPEVNAVVTYSANSSRIAAEPPQFHNCFYSFTTVLVCRVRYL